MTVARISEPEWELAEGCTYILSPDDVVDGRNKLGCDVRHIPLGVTLCGFCDQALPTSGYCADCRTIHVLDLPVREIGDGKFQVAA